MLRHVACLLLVVAILLCTSPLTPASQALAQDGSPIPIEPIPTETLSEPTAERSAIDLSSESVSPADATGNTPPGSYLSNQIFPREDVYFNVYEITVGGQTDVVDGTNGNGVFDAPGYRSDNAKVLTIVTTAQHSGDFRLCILFDNSAFSNPSAIAIFRLDGSVWTPITSVVDTTTACAYTPTFGVFAVAEVGSTPPTSLPSATSTVTQTTTPTLSPTPSGTQASTRTATATETSTSAPTSIQFALPNVYVTFLQIPTSGTTSGQVLSSAHVPALPSAYLAGNASYFSVASTVNQSGSKKLCVTFESATYADPHRLVLLQSNGSAWSALTGQVLDSLGSDQGTQCAYFSNFGVFGLVERAPATATATLVPSRTPTPTSTATSTPTLLPTQTASTTATATSSPSVPATGTSSATASSSPTPTPSTSPSATTPRTNTPTATLAPGSYLTGTVLRTTTRVNLRSTSSSSSTSLGIISNGATVTVTGQSIVSGGFIWVPVSSTLGVGWIAGNYLALNPTVTPTHTPAPPTTTRTPGGSSPTRTPSRTPTRASGGFIAGDAVRTTANVNLRSGPTTSATVLRVVPGKTEGTVTGPGVVSGGTTFYPVSIGGTSGYLAGSYLQRISATATPSRTRTPTATVVGIPVRYTTDDVNMRTGPGTSYRKIATIPEGTRVNITGTPRRSGGVDWYPVVINGTGSGWIAGSFLTATRPI